MSDSRNLTRSWSGIFVLLKWRDAAVHAPRVAGAEPPAVDSPRASADGRGDLRVERGFPPPAAARPGAFAVLRSAFPWLRRAASPPARPRPPGGSRTWCARA